MHCTVMTASKAGVPGDTHIVKDQYRDLARLNSPTNTYYQARTVMTCALCGDETLGQGSFGT